MRTMTWCLSLLGLCVTAGCFSSGLFAQDDAAAAAAARKKARADRVAALAKAAGASKTSLARAIEIAQKEVGGVAVEAEFELEGT
ncbi:MAG: hypothetical protein JNL94_09145, partial [Planctomycetes bacterium]|nr:hypothetical protein [Planctomycetota bacterium]